MHENTETRRVANTEKTLESQHIYPLRFVVVPAGIGFFHITECATGQVKGFRRNHLEACELARKLEA